MSVKAIAGELSAVNKSLNESFIALIQYIKRTNCLIPTIYCTNI